MTDKEIDPEKYYELIVQNIQSGYPYAIKFKGDPITYVGIPIIDRSEPSEEAFTFKVLEPQKKKGMFKRLIEDIELMESA